MRIDMLDEARSFDVCLDYQFRFEKQINNIIKKAFTFNIRPVYAAKVFSAGKLRLFCVKV